MLSSPSSTFRNLYELLRFRAEQEPDNLLYRFLVDGESQEAALSLGELDRRARAIATVLLESCRPGDRAMLLYAPGLAYVEAFFGCMYAGVVAVPMYPPDPARLARSVPRLRAVVEDAQVAVALTTSEIAAFIGAAPAELTAGLPRRLIPTDKLPAGTEHGFRAPDLREDTIAFLQYTSGSTSSPKGVRLGHDNLLANLALIQRCFELGPQSPTVIWLPPYHDMGLIGGILEPLYAGFQVILLSPMAFLQRPLRWLKAISRYRATTSGGPNFAYDLCVRKTSPAERETLDLSSWQVAFNGAEPIRAETLDRFVAAFGPAGFRRESFLPCYGLAEATLLVSGSPKSDAPVVATFDAAALREHRVATAGGEEHGLVSSGRVWGDLEITIIDPSTGTPAAPGRVGEIAVSHASIAHGYWNRPEETHKAFQPHEGRVRLHTGDLGFLHGGELFVTGRIKDLIVLRGRNVYPQDVERTVEDCHPGLRQGCGAAFGVDVDGEERLVIVQEVDPERVPDAGAVSQAVRTAVAAEHEVVPHAVVLIAPRTLPKTSSGKVQRHACRNGYVSRSLQVVHESKVEAEAPVPAQQASARAASERPRMPLFLERVLAVAPESERAEILAAYLQEQVAPVLELPAARVALDASLTSLGMDSLGAYDITAAIEAATGVEVPVASLIDGASLGDVATMVLRHRASEASKAPIAATGSAAPAADDAELSYGEQALWFLHQVAPDQGVYNLAFAARLRRKVAPARLQAAFAALVARHAALRTTFESVHGQPRRRVHAELPLDFEDIVLDAGGAGALDALLDQEAYRPFDLERGPLLRARLVACGEEQILVVAAHHLIMDGWSAGLLMQDLGRVYSDDRARSEHPGHYPEFVAWQRAWLASDDGAHALQHWKSRLSGALPTLDIPTDRARPKEQRFDGAACAFTLGLDLTRRLKQLARAQDVTLYTLLVTAFDVLLHRHSGAAEVLVGSPVAGRRPGQLTRTVGYFVNTVVLRSDVHDDPPFDALLHRTRTDVTEALRHQHVPHALIVERVQPARDPSRPALCQAMFVLQQGRSGDDASLAPFIIGAPDVTVRLSGLELESRPLRRRMAQYELSLFVADAEETLHGSLEYATSLFDAGTIARMVRRFERLLENIVREPTRRVSALDLVPEDERALIAAWNQTALAGAQPATTLHGLFEAQAALSPDAIALVASDATLRYAELDRRANALARELRAHGIHAGAPVAVCLGRTSALPVTLLAVLKAGGAYVPIDETYPHARVAFALEDTRAPVIVTERRLESLFEGLPGHIIFADDLPAVGASAAPVRVEPSSLAYIIFTSGSTGRPKGVAIEHRNAVAMIEWAKTVFGPGELACVLASTSICFDLSIFELFLPLAVGGAIMLVADVLELAELPGADRVTLVNTVPSAARELVARRAIPASVRTFNLAGEPLARDLVDAIYESSSVERVYNLYGPSETTTYSTFVHVPEGGGAVTIGAPIAGTQVHIVDRSLREVPIGVAGELYIGGAGVTRGYFGRPDLTAERFVPNPFGASGTRLYRTGDGARWLPSGELALLGRFDHQVKIRGFRIELGEIEAALRADRAVADVVVVVREDSPGDPRLVAYVAGKASEHIDGASLRAGLEAALPAYMIPSTFVFLERLPLTPNGKVDRRALPEPSVPAGEATRVVLRTADEQLVAGVWSELLGVDAPGADDDFFASGGHSLLAVRLTSRLRDVAGVELPIRTVFAARTIAQLALEVASARAGGATPLASIPIVSRDRRLPASSGQERLWFIEQLTPGRATYNVPAAVRLRGALDQRALATAFADVFARQESLRTRIVGIDGQPVLKIDPVESPGLPDSFDLPCVDVAGTVAEREASLRRLAQEEARRPFDLERGPLLRARLLRLGPEEHVLVVTMHHIVSDGWSLGVLIDELSQAYAARVAGQPLDLPPLTVQYADYATWQRNRLDAHAEALEWWKHRLDGAPLVLDLPVDHARPAVQSFRGERHGLRIDPKLAQDLQQIAHDEGATIFMAGLAAFATLLSRYTGQSDLLIGTDAANRPRSDLEGLIGFFVNPLVVRVDVASAPSFRELLRRVRDATASAYAHADMPFDRLVDAIQPARDLSRSPIVQSMFTVHESLWPRLRLAGLAAAPYPVDTQTAKFDLAVDLWPAEGGGLEGTIEYASDLFEPDTIGRFADAFGTLLADATRGPDEPVTRLAVMSETERTRVLESWNATSHPLPSLDPVHVLFARTVAATPDAIAVTFGGTQVTYRELAVRVEHLARGLAVRGVGPDRVVAILADRSIEFLVAILAVFQAGGAYLPLDPGHPIERTTRILGQSGARWILTSPAYLQRTQSLAAAPADGGAAVEVLELSAEPAWARAGSSSKEAKVEGQNLAYVIYTSGSTGMPKGAMVEHVGMLNHLYAKVIDLKLTAADCIAQTASQCFDISVWQFLASLLVGGRVHIVPDDVAHDPAKLVEECVEAGVTVLETVPSLLRIMLEERCLERPLAVLRWMIVTGEALPPDLCRGFLRVQSEIPMMNAYGPTECSDDVTHHIITSPPQEGAAAVPIGRPIINMRMYVLDRNALPLPVGVPGELYVGGIGVGRGYLNDPIRTSAAFVPDPFSPNPNDRLYRTGDLVRYLPDGALEFLGRIDHQVKVRGFRIELGEIEAALRAHVKDTVVVAHENAPGDIMLVAYVVGAPSADELRRALSGTLPDYMIPAEFVPLDAMPLTPNGKTDRSALPKPTGRTWSRAYIAPRTPVEQQIQRIWAEVLGAGTPIGIEDPFFEIGGHSLRATQIVSRIRMAFGVEVSLRAFFEAPTIAELADAVLHAQAEKAGANRVANLLERISELSDEEAARLLMELSAQDGGEG
jgi:amino acid adenylation domain-containing protein